MITLYQIPICPFCQRLEILSELKDLGDSIRFEIVDVTKPRPDHILELTGGTTALPVMELEDGRALKESLVLMQYIDDRFGPSIRREDPWERAVENLLVSMETRFGNAGYGFVLNQDPDQRDAKAERYLAMLQEVNDFLVRYATDDSPWLFDAFGWAEAVYTPIFQRFWFIEYYEGIDIPDEPRFERVRAWRDACVSHPAAQQTCKEEVVKLYYDYAKGAGNGGVPEGREISTFVTEPHWSERPWPPREKFGPSISDEALGLVS